MKVSAILAAAILAATTNAYTLTVASGTNLSGTRRSYSTAGTKSPGFTVRSWRWSSPPADGCCVRFCKGSTSVGYYCGAAENMSSTAGTNKVVLGCGSTQLRC